MINPDCKVHVLQIWEAAARALTSEKLSRRETIFDTQHTSDKCSRDSQSCNSSLHYHEKTMASRHVPVFKEGRVIIHFVSHPQHPLQVVS